MIPRPFAPRPLPAASAALTAACLTLALPALAQTAPAPDAAASAPTLAPVPVRARAETDKDSVRATTTRIGKGQQALRDIPQSVTVVTERLIDDRNLDTLKDGLRSTAGISFQAAEGQEEDIRLRGFALQSTGDIFLDGMRDPGFYDRDSFNWERLEVLKGSASMLFGRGSTGGAVNQVNKQPFQMDRNELSLTLGKGEYARAVLDLNQRTGEDAALRVNALVNVGDLNGLKTDKLGIAPTLRWGIGTRDEFSAGLYHLEVDNGIQYGFPWLDRKVAGVWQPDAYYGARSDRMSGGTTYGTLSHLHRFANRDELRTVLRVGRYERDQRASAIRFCQPNNAGVPNPSCPAVTERVTADTIGPDTVLTRGSQNKIQDMDAIYLQSDYSGRFGWFGLRHEVLAGVDLAVEDFTRYAAVSPPGMPGKGTTTIGHGSAAGWVDESLRAVRRSQQFDARAVGLYAQDLAQIAPAWKLLAGLRWDRFEGDYTTYDTGAGGPPGSPPPSGQVGDVSAERSRGDALWSRRFGLLYQPRDDLSLHVSYGTSFNTSGDTYAFDALGVNTPPEKSHNLELGGSVDWAEGRFTTRFALFHSTKYNERNRDEDSVDPSNYILSGERHAAGLDLDFAGRLTRDWELFAAFSWIPSAAVDKAGRVSGTTLVGGETVGARPAMTARASGSLWTTVRLTPRWRVGGGLNARSRLKPLLADFEAPGYLTADLMAEYDAGPALFKLNLANVADKLYAEQLYRGHFIAGKGRMLQLTMTTSF